MNKVYFKPLPIRRLSEIIEESIRELIARGELEAGSRLPSEKDIGKQFGVSVVTVREALRGLEAFGIIQKKRGRDGGVFVADSSSHWAAKTIYSLLISKKISARHVGEVRKIIQPACTKIAASRISPQELKNLEDNIKYCENRLKKQKSDSISESAFFHIEERNVEFHRLIAEATHNPVLALTADYVEDFLLSAKKSFLVPDLRFTTKAVTEHRIIYDYLKNGDAQAAENCMLLHCEWVEDHLATRETVPGATSNKRRISPKR